MSRSLGEFEQLLLFAVLRLGDAAYGARIRQEIEERTGRSLSAGAVYTGLDRLETRGLVGSHEGEATPVRGGRRKRYYRLEPRGAASLTESWDNVAGMADGVLPRLREMASHWLRAQEGRLPDDRRPAVIFVTAFREHAVEAFEVHAVDYVVKPFREDRLRAAVRRAQARRGRGEADAVWARLETLVRHLDDAAEGAARKDAQPATHTASAGRPAADEPPARRILVGDRDRRRFVSVDEVAWLEADGNYVRVHAAGETHMVRATLSGLARRLDPRAFVRVHRGTVVNLDRVREIQPWFAGRYLAILDDGTELRVSRSYREELLRLTR